MKNFEWYTGNLKWLPERTIFLSKHGSHAYGTATPTSDIDLRGVAIAPSYYYHGFLSNFEQAEQKGDPDVVVYDIRKFFRLAIDNNPNALEILFTDSSDLVTWSWLGRKLRDNRDLFLSQKCKHTFSGYAISQLKRINTHYRWLKSPPKAPPTRAEYRLPERTLIPKDQLQAAQSAIDKKLAQWNLTGMDAIDPATRILLQQTMAELLAEAKVTSDNLWMGAARSVGYDENFIELLDRERQYQGRQKEWEQYQGWLANRNVDRAAMEAKSGYDTKHGMHLVRLMRMCAELLETGKLNVKRHDAAELLEIRNGAWSYEKLVEYAEGEDKRLSALLKTTTLPHGPNREELDELCCNLVETMND